MATDLTPSTAIVLLGIVALVVSTPAAAMAQSGGVGQPIEVAQSGGVAQSGEVVHAAQTSTADYRIDSIEKLDYYNSQGFEDQNGDGRVVLAITTTLNMSKSRDPTLTYDGSDPLVLVGPGGFTDVPAPLISGVSSDSRLVLDSISIRNASADEHDDDVISVASPVSLDNVSVRNTIHEDRYPTDTFEETHRVSVVNAGGGVTVTDSEIAEAGQAISAGGDVEIDDSRIHQIAARGNGAVQAGGRAVLRNTVIAAATGARGGALNANGVLLRNTTLRDVQAGFSGGAINTGKGATIVDSTIRNAHARRNGGAIASEGRVVVRDSTIVDADADQDNSLYAYGAHLTLANTTLRDADAVDFGKGGISHGSIAVRDSRLIETSKLHAATIRVRRTTVNGSLSLYGREFTIRRSTFEHTGAIDGSTVTVANSTFRDVPKIQASQRIRVADSMLLSFGGFRSFQSDLDLTLSNVTLYRPGENVIPKAGDRTLRKLNVIEAETPVFAGRLPDKENVFIDTNNDSEPAKEWDADVFWSRDWPFPAAANIPAAVEQTPTATPTATATATATATETPTATPTPEPSATAVDSPDPRGDTNPRNDRQSGPSGGELPLSFPTLFLVASGSVAVGIVVLLFAVVLT